MDETKHFDAIPRPAGSDYALRTVAVYIERDGFRRLGHSASFGGVTLFGRDGFLVSVLDGDLRKLDAMRDAEYAVQRTRKLAGR